MLAHYFTHPPQTSWQSMFKPYLWPGYFLLTLQDLHAVDWGETMSIGDGAPQVTLTKDFRDFLCQF